MAAPHGGVIAALLLGATLLGFGLDRVPLLEPDEGRYADVSYAFLASGDWVVPQLNGTTFHDKPPLVPWLTALSFSAFGTTRAAARVVPCVSGVAGLALAAWIAHAASGRRRAAWLAALALAVAPLWLALSRTLTLDVPLAALTALGWALLVRGAGALGPAAPRAGLRWLGGAVVGLATLVKGPVAPVLVGGALLATALVERDRALAWRLLSPGPWLLTVAVAAPWYAAFARRSPGGAESFVLEQNVARFLAWDEHNAGPHFYPLALAWGLLPTTLLLAALARRPALASPAARACAWLATPPPVETRGLRCAGVFALVVVGFFSAASSKIETYVLPAYPPLAALAGVCLDRALRDPASRARLRRALLGVGAVIVALPAAWVGLALLGPAASHERWRLAAGPAWTSAALALAPAALVVAALARPGAGRSASAVGLTLVAFGLTGVSILPALGATATIQSAEPVGLAVRARRAPQQPVLTFGVYLRGLPYYVRSPVILSMSRGEMRDDEIQRERPDLILPHVDDVARYLARREPVLVVTTSAWRVALLCRLAAKAGARFEDGTLVHHGRFGNAHLFEVWRAPRAPSSP